MSKWTQFMDMHSGGSLKEPQQYIYIEAPEAEACVIFFNRFNHSPHRVTCTCCGEDYSVSESESLEQATAYNRNCDWDKWTDKYAERPRSDAPWKIGGYITLEQYLTRPDVLVIRESEIRPEERVGEIPDQGYVWKD